MARSLSTSSSDTWPRAATAAVVACLAIELLLAAFRPQFMSGLDFTVSWKRRRMADSSHQEDLLILGDSRIFSIRPDVVNQVFGGNKNVTNYSWPFAGVETIDYVLEAYLFYKEPPKTILVAWMSENLAVSPDRMSLASDPLYRTRIFNIVPAVPLIYRLLREGRWEMCWDYFEYRLLPPSVGYRTRLIELIRSAAITGRASIPNAADRRIIDSFNRHRSFLLYRDEVAGPDAVTSYEQAAGGLRLDTTLGNVAPFRSFLERAKANRISVILFNVPMPDGLYRRFDELGVIAEYQQVIARLRREFANFEVMEPALQVYPDEYFADVGHMNRRGDEQFAGYYGPAMKRWIQEHRSPE